MAQTDPYEKGLAAGEAAASAAGDTAEKSAKSNRMYVRTQSFGYINAMIQAVYGDA